MVRNRTLLLRPSPLEPASAHEPLLPRPSLQPRVAASAGEPPVPRRPRLRREQPLQPPQAASIEPPVIEPPPLSRQSPSLRRGSPLSGPGLVEALAAAAYLHCHGHGRAPATLHRLAPLPHRQVAAPRPTHLRASKPPSSGRACAPAPAASLLLNRQLPCASLAGLRRSGQPLRTSTRLRSTRHAAAALPPNRPAPAAFKSPLLFLVLTRHRQDAALDGVPSLQAISALGLAVPKSPNRWSTNLRQAVA